MSHIIQVGAGSGGMPVLDLVARDPRVTQVTLIEPDLFKPHNLERHVFAADAIGESKARTARKWLQDRRPDLAVAILEDDLLEPAAQARIETALATAQLGICAVDNEPAKYHWDSLMRRHQLPWTLGEVLSGGIGGFVHLFTPGGACYGCVASHLQRSVVVEKEKAPDYSQPNAAIAEATIPASRASIQIIASLHALLTLELLENPSGYDPSFTSMLFTLQKVSGVFDEAFRPYRFRIPRLPACLICGAGNPPTRAEDLDVALNQALARLGDA